MNPAEVLVLLLGAAAVLAVFLSAVTTVVVPRGVPVRLTRAVFLSARPLFEFRVRFVRDYEARDRAYALYAPLTLVSLPVVARGIPLRADRDQAWRDFVGWRVNYDVVLVALAALIRAPYAPWSSDRSPAIPHRPPLRRRSP